MDDEAAEWRANWVEQRRGVGCVLCGRSEIDDDEWGTRVFSGTAVAAFVWKTGVIPGTPLLCGRVAMSPSPPS
jgi:hypothetical protein